MTSRAVWSWLFVCSLSSDVRWCVQSWRMSPERLWTMILLSAMYVALLTAGVWSANVSLLCSMSVP